MPHKCSNCGAPGHRATYCPKCMATYRKVNAWLSNHRLGHTIVKHNTPAGFVYTVLYPDCDVIAWLDKRGKLPNIAVMEERAKLLSARSVLSA